MTLFERLAGMYGEETMSMLTVQYRMHELIMNWSSNELYDNKVIMKFLLVQMIKNCDNVIYFLF